MRKLLFYFFVMIILSPELFSDPSGWKYAGTLEQGNIIYTKEKEISMEDELLEITYSPQSTKVNIKYIFFNYTNNEKKLKIAFPRTYIDGYIQSNKTITTSEPGKFQNINIIFNNNKINYQIDKKEKQDFNSYYSNYTEKKPYPLSLIFERGIQIEENIIFDLNFKTNENILEIQYELNNFFFSIQDSRSFRWETLPFHFYFVLKTGGNWKDEKIKKFKTILKLVNCENKKINIIPNKFKKVNDIYIWEEKDFTPKEDLIIRH